MLYIVLLLVVLALLASAVTVLAIQNVSAFTTTLHLSLFAWSMPPLPVGLLLLIACLLGALLLYALAVVSALQDRRELQRLRKHVAELRRGEGGALWNRVWGPVSAEEDEQPGTLQSIPHPIVPIPGLAGPLLPPHAE